MYLTLWHEGEVSRKVVQMDTDEFWIRERRADAFYAAHGHFEWQECSDDCPGAGVDVSAVEVEP